MLLPSEYMDDLLVDDRRWIVVVAVMALVSGLRDLHRRLRTDRAADAVYGSATSSRAPSFA